MAYHIVYRHADGRVWQGYDSPDWHALRVLLRSRCRDHRRHPDRFSKPIRVVRV